MHLRLTREPSGELLLTMPIWTGVIVGLLALAVVLLLVCAFGDSIGYD